MSERAPVGPVEHASDGPAAGATKRRGERRGLGSLQLRGRIWWVSYSFRGKRYRESSKSTERRHAVKLLGRRLAEIGQGKLVGPDAERLTFCDLKQMVLTDYRVQGRKSTRRAEGGFRRLEDAFGFHRALDITPDRITAYVEKRQVGGAKAATIQYELSMLRRAFTLAYRAGKLPQRPHVPTLEVRNTRTGFFEEGEFRAVHGSLPEYLRGFVEFLYLTGWRCGEAVGLEWRQVDFTAGVVRLEPGTTKNDEGRSFPFAALPPLEAVLRRQREATTALERRTDRIVPQVFHRDGRRIGDFRSSWRNACAAAGVPGRIPHDLRRTAVRNLERAGVPRSVAMKLTGHKTENVFRRYAIVNEADLAQGVAKLARLHEAPSPYRPPVVALSGRRLTAKRAPAAAAEQEQEQDADAAAKAGD